MNIVAGLICLIGACNNSDWRFAGVLLFLSVLNFYAAMQKVS